MLGRRSWTFIFSLGCTLMLSGAAYTFAGTLLEETQKQLAIHAATVNGAWGGEITAGETPKSIPESKTGPVKLKGEDSTSLSNLPDAIAQNTSSATFTIPEVFAREFQMPTGQADRRFTALRAAGQVGVRRSVLIRRRDNGSVDILLTFINENQRDVTYFYYTSPSGSLVRAAHANGRIVIISNDDAREGFERERAFWRDWAATATTAMGGTGGSSSSGGGR